MIVVVDYGMGNLSSVAKAFQYIGEEVTISNTPAQVVSADRLVVPGVGAFGDAVAELNKQGLTDAIKQFVATGRPFLGICLGMQLLLDGSEEAPGEEGLGLISGMNRLFQGPAFQGKDRLKVPHMGWNNIRRTQPICPMFRKIEDDSFVYFVHSYYADVVDTAYMACETDYGIPFASALWKDNIFATQFHPEKSQDIGLAILKEFAHV